jgi:hypothetical protein
MQLAKPVRRRIFFVISIFQTLRRGSDVAPRISETISGGVRMKNLVLSLTILCSFLFVSGRALAHHGVANYDSTKVVSVKGAVTEFRFINPHVLISLDVKNDKGEAENWSGEAQSPAMLVRYGWNKDLLKVGMIITASGYRTKDGTNFLRLTKIVLPDGREMGNL